MNGFRFVAMQERVNDAAFRRLSNADAVLGGAVVRGIFDDAPELADVGASGMASEQPVFTLPTSSIFGEPVGQALVVRGANYVVAAHEPDGAGVSRLLLEAA